MTAPIDSPEADIGTAPDVDSSSDVYAQRFSGKAGEWLLQRQSYFTELHILEVVPSELLDVGGGHAQNVALAEKLNIPLTITGSTVGCKHRVDRISRLGSTRFLQMPLLPLDLPERGFAQVISYRIVSHMLDWQGFIAGLCRVSSDAVTIDFAARRSVNFFSELAFRIKQGQESDTRRYNVLPESQVDHVFAQQGFIKAKRSAQFFFPMAIHRRLKSPKLSYFLETLAKITGLAALFGSPVIVTYRRES